MKKKEPHYYQIRAGLFWGMIGVWVSLTVAAYFKEDLYCMWLHCRGRETVACVGIESQLEEKKECYLCGSSSQSLQERYGETDMVGVISLNDWYVLEFPLGSRGEGEEEGMTGGGLTTTFGNTGELTYLSKGIGKKGMASIEITLPDNYRLDPDMMQNHLCQECIDKIQVSLNYSKWRNEKKERVPLCLIDFKTLEIYSLQDWHRGCMIRDYWVEMNPDKEKIGLKIFSLSDKESKIPAS